MKIKNFKNLAKNKLRRQALEIVEAGLDAIDTKKAIRSHVFIKHKKLYVKNKKYSLKKINRIFVVGIGKCSVDAGEALEEVMGKHIEAGIVFDVRESKNLKKIKSFSGTHPYPTKKNINATLKIINLLKELDKNDLVIMIISGGGSTLLCQPEEYTCHQEKDLLKCLFDGGANIYEINTIRKHLSLARGGNLVKYAYPAKIVSLIFSDVPGNKLEFIASGPTIRDTTTVFDAKQIFKRFKLKERCGIEDAYLMETPKEAKYFRRTYNFLFISNKDALLAMARRATLLGFLPKICNYCLTGEAREFGKVINYELEKLKIRKALLYGGETEVTITGKGKGGRNQEVVLSALSNIKEGEVIVSFASDGWDNTNHAGAIGDIETLRKAKELGLNLDKYLKNNNSYNFFAKIGDFLDMGYTGSNVSDLVLLLKK